MVETEARIELPPDLLLRARAGDAEAFCEMTEPLQAALLRQATALAGVEHGGRSGFRNPRGGLDESCSL